MPYYGEIYGGIDPNEVEGFQVGLINTPHRIDVYLDAFKELDVTNKVVCDLGAGSGLLALEALRLGARKVYCVELNPKGFEYLTAIVNAHPQKDQVTLINKDICELTRSDFAEPVDVFVSETLSGLGCYNEGIIHYMNHVRSLYPTAALIPSQIETHLKFVEPNYSDPNFWPQYEHQPALLEGYKLHNNKLQLPQESSDYYGEISEKSDIAKTVLRWNTREEVTHSNYQTHKEYHNTVILLDHEVMYSPGVVKNWNYDMWFYNHIEQETEIMIFLHDKCELVMDVVDD